MSVWCFVALGSGARLGLVELPRKLCVLPSIVRAIQGLGV